MRIGICDDDSLWLHKSQHILSEYYRKQGTEAEISVYLNREQLLDSIHNIDLLFIDIELERDNGIEVVKRINEMNPECFVVFVTNHLYYATDVYDAKHDYFITKEHFTEKLDQIRILYDKNDMVEKGVLSIYTIDKVAALVPVYRIFYMERAERTTQITTTHGAYLVKDKIEELREELEPYDFLQCHKSFMVNPAHVRECRKTEFVMNDGRTIPISRRYGKASREQFLQWMSMHLL